MKRTKDDVQREARAAWDDNRQWGLLDIATGVGKSKIAVDAVSDIVEKNPDARVYLVVPTRKLRDRNWPEEFEKWGKLAIWEKNVIRICYASAHKVKSETIHLIIFDEGHNLTVRAAKVILDNNVRRLLVLTATVPKATGGDTDKLKNKIFKYFKVRQLYYYSLDQALKDGLISNFELRIVECTLDDTQKYLRAGSKTKGYFYQTEAAAYAFANKRLKNMYQNGSGKMGGILRSQTLKSFVSKREVAKRILKTKVKPGERCIIFCGSIKQAENICPGATYHSKGDDSAFELFLNEELDVLAVVDAVDEGHNIPRVDSAIVVQISKSERVLVQRVGRIIRLRENVNHLAVMWILYYIGTVDEEHFRSAISPFSSDNITYYHWKDVVK